MWGWGGGGVGAGGFGGGGGGGCVREERERGFSCLISRPTLSSSSPPACEQGHHFSAGRPTSSRLPPPPPPTPSAATLSDPSFPHPTPHTHTHVAVPALYIPSYHGCCLLPLRILFRFRWAVDGACRFLCNAAWEVVPSRSFPSDFFFFFFKGWGWGFWMVGGVGVWRRPFFHYVFISLCQPPPLPSAHCATPFRVLVAS